MADLVTLAEAKLHIRVDHDDEDDSIELMIAAATSSIMSYLKWDELPDTIPTQAAQACLMLVGYMYREREGSNEYAVPEQYGYGYLPLGVVSILYPIRKPSLA